MTAPDDDDAPETQADLDAYAREIAMKALEIGVQSGVAFESMAITLLFTGFLAIQGRSGPQAAADLAEMFANSLRRGELKPPGAK